MPHGRRKLGRERDWALSHPEAAVQKTALRALENDTTVFHFRTDGGGWMFAFSIMGSLKPNRWMVERIHSTEYEQRGSSELGLHTHQLWRPERC